ncbi:LysR family transcriptional regulator [Marinomonas mediterranea]|uniref:Transcriptional regulator, LysR family n=1 Tax=Marinomonas mediterranea (strain ATCC 700492 / JCM 21426 / NBRC 103028 / MMB-1) TaxID=717774 RepID=F2JY97_MARM1|nr:LysR family transcriptional regulator [Marinomonas mediterranea]ADZ91928.1 transcriptional regulator, LysR family [Marinomonas mediterranea MMB-1]
MKPDKHINIRLLEVFASVVKHQGYSGAQQDLNLSTSAISNYMSELEAYVGFTLCQRGRSGFLLTEKGQQFLHQAIKLLDEMNDLERHTEMLKGDLGGTFRIAVLDATVLDETLSMPNIIRQFNDRFPAVHINLQIRSPNEQIQGVLNNHLDMAIGNFPSSVNNLVEEKLYREQHWLYCSHRHPLFIQKQVSVQQVAQCGLVTRSYWNSTELKRKGFGHSTATVESMEAQLTLILSGKYVGYLPEHYAQNMVKENQLRPLLPSEFGYQAPFSMICRRGRSRETFIQTMRNLLIKQTKTKAK